LKICCLFKPAVPLLVSALFALAACSDPIFYSISQEVAPIEPLIPGGPTNFAEYKNYLYVASGYTLYRYQEGKWESETKWQPGGRINSLAAAGSYMYALCGETNLGIKRFDGTNWDNVKNTTGSDVQYMYAAGSYVFFGAGTGSGDSFTGYYIDTDGTSIKSISISPEVNFKLCGAAYAGTTYYLCIREGGGIYTSTSVSSSFSQISGTASINFAGIIKLSNSSIVAISREGTLYTVSSSEIKGIASIPDYSTYALAIWQDPSDPDNQDKRLLLAAKGNIGSAYSNGYVELELDSNGIKSGASFKKPGSSSPSSIVDGQEGHYDSSIGRLVINYMYQAPKSVDSGMRLFASTQKDGVWSYRNRGTYQWNAED